MATTVRRTRTARDIPAKTADELSEVVAAIRKRYGDGAIVQGGALTQPLRISTGVFSLDYATLGGLPYGRVIQFDGAKHSGKTTGAMRAVAGAQAALPDHQPIFVDIEHTFDKVWAEKTGVDCDRLLVVEPDTGEQAVDMIVGLMHAAETSLVVLDSAAAMLPQKESEASAEDSLVGQQSRLITSMLRKINGAMIKEKKRGHFPTFLVINQQRAKIGGWAPAGQEALSNPGGKAMGFFTSLEVTWRNKENVKKDDTGQETLAYNEHTFKIGKNKLNSGIRSGEFQMMRRFDAETGLQEGEIDEAGTMLSLAKRLGWYTGGGRGGYTLEFGSVNLHAANAAEMTRILYEERASLWALRCHLIADNARRLGQEDWFVEYLLGGN